MPSGYQSGAVDLDTIFAPYAGGAKAAATGYQVAGVDLSDRYAPVGSAKAALTGIQAGGADLNARFALRADIDPYYPQVVTLLHFDGTNGATATSDQKGRAWTFEGNTVLTSAFSRFGATSIAFDGNGDSLYCAGSADFAYGSGPFTIEGWLRVSALPAGERGFYEQDGASPIRLTLNAAGQITAGTTGGSIVSGAVIAASGFRHIALVREGGTMRLFVEGVLQGQVADSGSYGGLPSVSLGAARASMASTAWLNCFLDEWRITKGVARYTANFTPPAAAFQNS